MKTLLKWVLGAFGVVVIAFVALFIATRGDYPVSQLVTEDASLPSAEIAGVQLHLRIIDGPPGAETVIVLHGGPGGDFRSLQGLEVLADTFRVVFYDQRGAGLSERVDASALTLDGHVDELGAVIDHVAGGSRPILIGHSWGAMLATAFLGRHPERVASAVLIEPGFLDEPGRQSWREESAKYLSGLVYVREAVLNGFRAQHVSGPDPSAPDDFLIGRMVQVFANHPENPYHCGEGYTAPGWRFGALSSQTMDAAPASEIDRIAADAASFDRSVLLMAGACNDWIGADLQRQHLDLFQNGSLAVVEDAGHDVIWDDPEVAIETIRQFLAAQE